MDSTHVEPPLSPVPGGSAHFDTGFRFPDNPDNDTDDGLTEEQMRQEYEDQEINRFLELFRVYVSEVTLPNASPIPTPSGDHRTPSASTIDLTDPDLGDSPSDGWVSVEDTPIAPAKALNSASLSEKVAINYLGPILPPPPAPRPQFNLGRLRLSLQRLYLATVPTYLPYFRAAASLSTWKERDKSLAGCLTYWVLWWFNLVLPGFILSLICAMLRRKMFPYPTLTDLRRRRTEFAKADEFSSQISSRLTASSSFVEWWRLLKIVNRTKKARAMNLKNKFKTLDSDNTDSLGSPVEVPDEPTVLDPDNVSQEELDLKRDALHLLNQLADFNERVKNLFIWRKPAVTRFYLFMSGVIFFITLLCPAQYLAKAIYFILGFIYWHMVPLMAALPPSDRRRLPPPFSDIPTDADYAMTLISQRAAAGLDVVPPKKNKAKQGTTDTADVQTAGRKSQDGKSSGIDWKKWSDRVAVGKSIADDSKRLLSGKKWQQSGSWPPASGLVPPAVAIGQPGAPAETHTFPAQHTSAPGLITLTSTALMFTPLMSWDPKVIVPLSDLRAVKKAGVMKGLIVKYMGDGDQAEREEKFKFVGSRDELFARLVGANDGRRWLKS